MQITISDHQAWFKEYASGKIAQAANPLPLELKLYHTQKVLEKASHIIQNEMPDKKEVCLLAALYHDIARFDQYLDYGTFKDSLSFNHGIAGVRILKKMGRLKSETKMDRDLILAAVGLHNRYALPQSLPDAFLGICQIIRDADKLDILRIMDEHLGKPGPYNPTVVLSLPDDPDVYSQKVIDKVLARQVPSYDDLQSVNDFRILLGSWFYDMHFQSSRELFISQGHAHNLVSRLPNDRIYGKAKAELLQRLAGNV